MKLETVDKPFDIIFQVLERGAVLSERRQSFFELIYIVSGEGEQLINNNILEYQKGQLFLITPQDSFSFNVRIRTEFFIIKFNGLYIKSNMLHSENIQRLEFILNNAGHKPGSLLRSQRDEDLVKLLIENTLQEYLNEGLYLYKNELIVQLVNTLIIVVARNIAHSFPDKVQFNTCSETKTLNILQYIQANIYDSEKIRSKVIAQYFGISDFYIGRYFKKHTNETLQQYIINYKLKLIETRLLYSDLRINEIAMELGFTDESHMNKLFRKNRGVSLKEFRKRARWENNQEEPFVIS